MNRQPKQLLGNVALISEQINPQRLQVVLNQLKNSLVAAIPGDVVEFGCYIGTTSLFIRRALDTAKESGQRQFWAYDSFAGLPAKHSADNSTAGSQFVAGELSVSKKQLLQEFHKAHLVPPRVYKAWFKDVTPTQLPEHIAFAFLDGDFYESITDSLKLVWPRLSTGGIITIDDYQREALPGVERAVDEFFQGKKISLRQEHNIAIIKKL